MIETLASIIVVGLGLYALIGFLFAVPFLLWGAGRVDPAAQEGSIGFRLLILPGTIALWPVLWQRLRPAAGDSA